MPHESDLPGANPIPPSAIDAELLDRYLAGTSDPDERRLVEAWRSAHSTLGMLVEELRHVGARGPVSEQVYDAPAALERLRRQVDEPKGEARGIRRALAQGNAGAIWRSAARWPLYAMLALVGAVLVVRYAPERMGSSSSVPKARTYATRAGERANITLADGSQVILAPETQLRVVGRIVELKGHALFRVTPGKGAPFLVRAKGQETRVLGTTFSVRGYDSDPAVRVAVRDGKVSIARTVLTAGDLALVTHATTTVLHAHLLDTEFALASGELVLPESSLRTAIPELERWFAVRIRVVDPQLLDIPLRGTFSGEGVTALADILAPTLGVRAERQGNTLILHTLDPQL